jgi:predicted metal-dependent phosphotriesterase family hydrolase
MPQPIQAVCRTVRGDVDPGALGRVLAHEHLLSLLVGPGTLGPDTSAEEFVEAQVEAAVKALSGLRELGFGTVVDLSPYGDVGRDAHGASAALLPRISEMSGLHIVSGTATYREEFSPDWVKQATVEEIVRRFVADATTGIGAIGDSGDSDSGSGVRAGILGEQPTSEGRITEHEERGLRAAARAHHLTGLALNTHTTHGTMALEQIDLLEEEGVALDRVVIGHMDNHPDLDYVRRVLDRGVSIGFDSVGKQYWDVRRPMLPDQHPDGPYAKAAIKQSDRTRADRLAALVAEGYAEQIVLSQDLTGGQMWLNPATHGRYGYGYLGRVFLPRLEEAGVGQQDIDRMLIANPARLLAVPALNTDV